MSGIPVRLVERGEGRLISLDCLEHHITTQRKVSVMRMPVAGQRYGLDTNMVNLVIKLVCIVRDDDCSAADLVAQQATSYIDFSTSSKGTNYAVGAGGQLLGAWSDINGARFEFRATDGTIYTATFDTSATNHDGTTDPLNIVVGLKTLSDAGGNPKGADLATRLKGALEHNTSAANRFSAKFSISVSDGQKGPVISLTNERQTKLTFTQLTAGMAGNNDTPVFVAPTSENKVGSNNLGDTTLESPLLRTFIGGIENNCRSAGDKVQDLLANVVNSNFAGLSGTFKDVGDTPIIPNFDAEGYSHKDYVLGLQLPYNSLTQAKLGTVGDLNQGYEPRNFMVMTGLVKSDQQGSAANDLPASTPFVPTDKYTGIHGCITECTISYIAGDTTYAADITFQPLDILVGI